MDQHGEKEETNSQESASAADQREETAAAEGEDTSEESMDQRKEDGYKADESTGLVEDDVVGSEEASAPPPFAHPWSLLRACAGCLGLLGCCGDQKLPPSAVAATEAATATAVGKCLAAARSSQEEEAGGDAGEKAKANVSGSIAA